MLHPQTDGLLDSTKKMDRTEWFIKQTTFLHQKTNTYTFFSDAPHLIKTARNCFSNSFSHRNSRKMWKDGRDISWVHIVNLYKDHCSGLYRRCPKLKRAHIDITPFSCMKVSFAAQVLSSTVANAIEMLYEDETSETVTFIRHMNIFFDCLNTRIFDKAAKSRNDHVKPFPLLMILV